MILRMSFWPWCLGVLCMLCAFSAAHGQTLTVYTTESSYDTAIPAGSVSTVEDFASVTTEYTVAESPAEDSWNGFTVYKIGLNFNYGESYVCDNFDGCGTGSWGQQNPPSLKGIRATLAGSGFGNGQVIFTPTNPAFAYGMNHWAWTSSESDIEVTLSNGAIRIVSGSGNTGVGFVGFKLDSASIASGIYISSFRWKAVSGSNFNHDVVALWNVKSSSPPPPDPMIVTSTADTNTVGTLRYAMNWANANAGDDNIMFDIPGTGPHVLSLASALPSITDDNVSVNGISQSGASCGDLWNGTPHTLMIELNATNAFTGLEIGADNVNIRGLSITGANRKVNFNNSSSNSSVTCSYLGLGIDGIAAGGNQGVVIGGTNNIAGGGDTNDGNVISGNLFNGVIILDGAVGAKVQRNFIGTSPDGTASEANGYSGIGGFDFSSVASINEIRGNLISGNTQHGIHFNDDSTFTGSIGDIIIAGNYIGLARTGGAALPNGDHGIYFENGSTSGVTIGGTSSDDRNVISGNGADGINLGIISDVTILGNYIGLGADGSTDVGNTGSGIETSGATSLSIGDGTSAGRNIISSNGSVGIDLKSNSSATISENYIGVASDGTTARGNRSVNIAVQSNSTALITKNIIAYSVTNDGIEVQSGTPFAAITENSIFGNTQQAIELDDFGSAGEGVNDNDIGDADTGPNDLLNFPLINTITASGTTSVGYSVELDVPANTEGYRIEFFKNSSPDTTNGEGEIFLGFVDTGDHTGGAISFDGTFTASEAVSVDDSISATTTRKTATGYDITSEFAVNVLAVSPLVVTNINDSGTGSLRTAIDYANANTAADNITFQIPGTGPHVITLSSSAELSLTDDGITIDGETQTGASCGQLSAGTPHNLQIELDKNSLNQIALRIAANNVTVRGLSIGGSNSVGVRTSSGYSDLILECNYIGMRADGITPNPNAQGSNLSSIYIESHTDAIIRNNLLSGSNTNNFDSGLVYYNSTGGSITGNLIGTDETGLIAVPNGVGINLRQGTTNVTIGGSSQNSRNIISGNNESGIDLDPTASDIDILGNYIGTNIAGTSSLANGEHGIYAQNVTNLTIGGAATGAGNVISGNVNHGVYATSLGGAALIENNYIGVDASGIVGLGNGNDGFRVLGTSPNVSLVDNVFSGANNTADGTGYGLVVQGNSVVTALGNHIGVGADGTTAIANANSGVIANGSAQLNLGDGTLTNSNIISSNSNNGVMFQDTATGIISMNTIANNGARGVFLSDSSSAAMLANSIFNNTILGIDLVGSSGVDNNDIGDADTGPNDLLNFPVINDFASDGTTGMTYDINLDVPAGDYRIDFYRNSAVDSSGHGEGEFHLGFVELTHTGGDQQHTGAFTANSAVEQGNYIAATTTRKTGPSAYDITSEFSLTTTTGSPTELTAVKSVDVYDPTSAGLYSLPGNDVISSLTVTNPGSSPADADSIVIIDAIPAEVTFYNGDIDDGGPHSNAISFVQTGGANLTFTYLTDVKYSNSGIRPTDMSGCTYSPSAGYDTNVTFICLNPKGAMAAGNPDPTFTVAYRAKIK